MELLVQQLITKLDIVKNIIQKININFNGLNKINNDLLSDFDKIETNFTTSIGSLYTNRIDKIKTQFDITQYLLAEDFSNELNNLLTKIKNILSNNKIDIDTNLLLKKKTKKKELLVDIQYLFNVFPWTVNIPSNSNNTNYSKCTLCNNNMTIDSNKSELKCNECGVIKELVGTVFDDTHFYNQEGQKTKSGTFNPNRHFQFWWSHILAKESEEELGDKKDPTNMYGERVLKQIRDIIERDHKILQLLSVNDIRVILREIERTDLNKNIPLILKKLTGIGPPNVPDYITMKVENLFTKAIEIGEKIKHNKRINRNYYPYYIYRIIEAITEESDFELRHILYYIYIQSKETVESDDIDWEKICNELKEIKYKPTDRTLGLQYTHVL